MGAGSVQGSGKGAGCQKVQNSSYKIDKSWHVMYSMMTCHWWKLYYHHPLHIFCRFWKLILNQLHRMYSSWLTLPIFFYLFHGFKSLYKMKKVQMNKWLIHLVNETIWKSWLENSLFKKNNSVLGVLLTIQNV